jgi:hypothetical protein
VLIVADGQHAGRRFASVAARDARIAGRIAMESVPARTSSADVASERDSITNATAASARFPTALTRSLTASARQSPAP